MAGEDDGLTLLLRAILDAKGFDDLQTRLQEAKEKASEAAQGPNEFSSALADMGTKLLAATGLAVGLSEAFGFLKSSFSAAVEESRVLDQMRASNEALGGATKDAREANEAWLLSVEAASGKTKEELIPGYIRLVAVTGDVSEAQRITQIAAGAAAKGYGDLGQITQTLIRYYQTGQIQSRGFGAVLKSLVGDAKDVGDGFAKLDTQFGDSGSSVDNLGVKVDRMGVAWKEFKAVIGGLFTFLIDKLSPVLKVVTIGIAGLLDAFDDNSKHAEKMAKAWGDAGESGKNLNKDQAKIKGGLKDIETSVADVTKAYDLQALTARNASKSVVDGIKAELAIYKTMAADPAFLKATGGDPAEKEKLIAKILALEKQLTSAIKSESSQRVAIVKSSYDDELKRAEIDSVSKFDLLNREIAIYKKMRDDAKLTDSERTDATLKLKNAEKALNDEIEKHGIEALLKKGRTLKQVQDDFAKEQDAELKKTQQTADKEYKASVDKWKKIHKTDLLYDAEYVAMLQQSLINWQGTEEEKEKIHAEVTGKIIEMDRARAQNAANVANAAANAFITTAGETFGIGKEVAIAQAIMDTYAGAAKALSQTGIYGEIAAALIIATGLMDVAKIESQNVSTGSMSSFGADVGGGKSLGFDNPSNDLAAIIGGQRWASDMVDHFTSGASMGFSQGMARVGAGGGGSVSNVTNRSSSFAPQITFNGIVSADRATLMKFTKDHLTPVLNRYDPPEDDAVSIIYSLRAKPNWMSQFAPAWGDYTDALDVTSLPSITVATERQDEPLTASVGDLSLTVSNADGRWDDFFDTLKIIGTLPPVGPIRAPATHYGKVVFCRRATTRAQWHEAWFGFIDPISPQFDRDARTCTFTAYAAGKLLEQGNAERVNRFRDMCPARPFLVRGGLTHPVALPDSPDGTPTDPTWWLAADAARDGIYVGDQFQAVHDVPWAEGVATVPYDNTTYNIVAVAPRGADVYFQTAESSALIIGPSSLSTAIMEYVNPWYHSRRWEELIQDLVDEANAALTALGVDDQISVDLTNLPLLPVGRTIFAEPVNSSDIFPPITGVAYQKNSGTRYLLYSRERTPDAGELNGKSDILGANDLPGEPIAIPTFTPPGLAGDVGPDYGKLMRILSPTPILGAVADDAESDAGYDFALCGQDVHAFNANEVQSSKFFDSIHWTRTPESYESGGEPKRFYRIYCRGRWVTPTNQFKKGIEITEYTTPDSGATWAAASTHSNLAFYPTDDDPAPNMGRWAARPDFKLFRLLGSNRLYCWTDPVKNECYVLSSTSESLPASSFFSSPSFIGAESVGAPVGSSGFVTEGAGTATVWFFSDRADLTGVDLWFWDGAAMQKGQDLIAHGFPGLHGGDFINAITDTSNGRHMLYVAVGAALYAITYTWDISTGTLAATDWQAIELDQVNYSQTAELQAGANGGSFVAPGAIAWLTGPCLQANPNEPDYTVASASVIVGTVNAIYIVSNAAVNIVDVADFEGLSCAAAISEMIFLRGYYVLTEGSEDLIDDPAVLNPTATVRFRQRLIPNPAVTDLTEATEMMTIGTWLEAFSSVQVQNSKRKLGPVGSDSVLTTADGVSFSINPPRNAQSTALAIDNPLLSTTSFCKLLANLFAVEFAVPRPDAQLVVRDPYSLGLGFILKPGDWIEYLVRPPDGVLPALTLKGRILSLDYALDNALTTLKVA